MMTDVMAKPHPLIASDRVEVLRCEGRTWSGSPPSNG